MEEPAVPQARRRRLLAKFTGASLIGFVFSAATLHLGLDAGLRPWAARLIALVVAMHVTFLINGRFVFKALTRERFFGLWGAYMTNSAFGNLCNYCVFVALHGSHRPIVGRAWVAFLAGSVAAWAINFLGARFVVFSEKGRRAALRVCRAALSRSAPRPAAEPVRSGVPAPGERGWSRR